MEIKFHGDNSNVLSLEVGDLLRFVDVTGQIRQGVLVDVEKCGYPRQGIVYLQLLEGDTLSKVDTNRIFKCRRVNG